MSVVVLKRCMIHSFTFMCFMTCPLYLAQQYGRGWLPDGSTVVTGLMVRLGQELSNNNFL